MPESLRFTAAARFEAARTVAVLPDGHRCRRLHGHGFTARVWAAPDASWAPFAGAEVETLEQCLERAVGDLDYRFLNELLSVPTDEELARWLRRRLERQSVAQRSVPGIVAVGVQSTPDQGADLDGQGRVHVWRRFRFEAAHQLPNVPADHQCGRMHGHGFEVVLHAVQPLAEGEHLGIDYDRLEERWVPFIHELDHRCLNDVKGLENPTSEMLAAWLWARLKPQLPELSWVSVYETVTAGCHFDGARHRIWKEFRCESALRLAAAPEHHAARRLHGHSYRLKLHLSAPLDQVLGWTVDYGDVKRLFDPVYRLLDHHRIDALDGLAQPDAAQLARWIRNRAAPLLPQLDRIDLEERPGCGVVLAWGDEAPILPL
jgi:6-pyruvoyltetrahydropterin/6-carboxytetrahydropterin synthase